MSERRAVGSVQELLLIKEFQVHGTMAKIITVILIVVSQARTLRPGPELTGEYSKRYAVSSLSYTSSRRPSDEWSFPSMEPSERLSRSSAGRVFCPSPLCWTGTDMPQR